MEKSNIIYSSNVYPAKGRIKEDKEYISKITDYERLKSIQGKINRVTDYSILLPMQHEIIDKGVLCSEAEHDPCWGVKRYGNNIMWSCKCVNAECPAFGNCRTDFDVLEYEVFSPQKHNSSVDFLYKGVAYEDHYHVIYGNEDKNFGFDDNYFNSSSSLTSNTSHERKITDIHVDVVKSVISVKIKDSEDKQFETFAMDLKDTEIEFDEEIVQGKIGNNHLLKHNEEVTLSDNIFKQFLPIGQDDIIHAENDANIFVNAGPGTGKTYTLIKKINYLVSNLNLEPEGIQVLSFTNAAVTEIKNRLNGFVQSGGDRGLRNLDVRTFHSMAWWLLGQANESLTERGWKPVELSFDCMDYDDSILKAAILIDKFPDIVSGWNHLIVDEAQDLTGNKAIFVLSLIRACLKEGCSFSVFGDSCQAIYDYIQKSDANSITSDRFYSLLYSQVFGNGKFVRLEQNYRQTDSLINLTTDLRSAILGRSQAELNRAVADLQTKIPKLDKTVLMLDQITMDDLSGGKSVCFLCRNNGQTLRLSTILRKNQIPHVLNAYELVENFAPWIGEVFIEYKNNTMTFEQFALTLADKKIVFSNYTVKDVWEQIKKLLRSKSEIIDVAEFLEALKSCKADDPVFRVVPSGNIIVSNIHRAKGREYESVVLDESFINDFSPKRVDIGEYKTLYVAITRPKKAIKTCRISNSRISKYTIYKTGRKRWASYNNGKLSYFEFKSEDYVNKIAFINEDAIKRQNYISTIKAGDEIKLKRVVNGGKLHYDIVHISNDTEVVIGKSNKNLVDDLHQIIKPENAIEMPAYIEDLFVESVYTHIEGSRFDTIFPDIKDITKFCIWNWVNIQGLGHLIYDTY